MLLLLTKRHSFDHTEVSFLMPLCKKTCSPADTELSSHGSFCYISFGCGLPFPWYVPGSQWGLFDFPLYELCFPGYFCLFLLQSLGMRSKHLYRAVIALPDSSSWAFMETESIYSPTFCCELCVGWQNE